MQTADNLPNPLPASPTALPNGRVKLLWWFLAVVIVMFLARTASFWHHGRLLAGTHADEPYHYTAELLRVAPHYYPDDPAVQDTRTLGEPYASFYRFVAWLVVTSGLELREVSIAVCWTANIIYLAGVMLFLRWLGVSSWLCAIGTIIVSQRFVFMSSHSLVTHGLAIPREVWQSLMPWFLWWFAAGRRERARLVLFYAVLGAVFAATYAPWAVALGLGFGLVDLSRIVRQRTWRELGWLTAAAVVCGGTVAAFNLGQAGDYGGAQSALLDRLKPGKLIYFTKSFRLFLLFSLFGLWAFWQLGWEQVRQREPLRRLWHLWIASFAVCWIYPPIEQVFPPLAMLFLKRLSLVNALLSLVVAVVCLNQRFASFAFWKKSIVVAVAVLLCFFSMRKAYRGRFDLSLVDFCEAIKGRTPVEALFFVPPVDDAQYFRVYADRGMWITPYDKTTLWHTKKDYAMMQERVTTLKGFYDPAAAAGERETVLKRLHGDGVDYVVTHKDSAWAPELSWPIVFQHGPWQLHAPRPGP